MICKKCKQDISPDCCYDNHICVFCYHNITEWDSNGQLITKNDVTRWIGWFYKEDLDYLEERLKIGL